jgi:hypothetical protein
MTNDVVPSVAYEILEECKYGREEFFVLISSVDYLDPAELEAFKAALLNLTEKGLLNVYRGDQQLSRFDEGVLARYLDARVAAGENLDDPTSACEELAFETTDAGVAILRPEDRP